MATCANEPAAVTYKEDNLLTIDLHPHQDMMASGTVQGDVYFHKFAPSESTQLINTLKLAKDSCRDVQFSMTGELLYCGLKDKSLVVVDVETQKILRLQKDSHIAPCNALHCVSERLLASGDENGCIKVWDTRSWKEAISITENTDFISDITSKDLSMLCTSGDGSLTVVDLRQRKMEARSDCSESELLCLSLVKGGSRVVTGNGEGVLGIFMWDLWGDIVERHPILPPTDSIDSLVQISDSVVCAGGMDGKLRAVQILPNKTIGEIGQHSMDYSVDGLRLTHNKQFLVSNSFDLIKFWSTEEIPTMWIDGDEEMEEKKTTGHRRKKRKNRKEVIQDGKKPKYTINEDFFSDL